MGRHFRNRTRYCNRSSDSPNYTTRRSPGDRRCNRLLRCWRGALAEQTQRNHYNTGRHERPPFGNVNKPIRTVLRRPENLAIRSRQFERGRDWNPLSRFPRQRHPPRGCSEMAAYSVSVPVPNARLPDSAPTLGICLGSDRQCGPAISPLHRRRVLQ